MLKLNTRANVNVLRMLAFFILEEILNGIAIVDPKNDRTEFQVETCSDQHGVVGQRLLVVVYTVVRDLQ